MGEKGALECCVCFQVFCSLRAQSLLILNETHFVYTPLAVNKSSEILAA